MTEPAHEQLGPVKDRVLHSAFAELARHEDWLAATESYPESAENKITNTTCN